MPRRTILDAMDAERSRALIQRALTAVPRGIEAEARLLGGRWAQAVLTHGQLLHHRSRDHVRLHLRLASRVRKRWRVAQGWTSDLTDDAITRLASRLRDHLAVAPSLPRYRPLPTPREAGTPEPIEGYDQILAVTGPVMRTNELAWFEIMSRRHDILADARYQTSEGDFSLEGAPRAFALGNHHGVYHHHLGTRCDLTATLTFDGVPIHLHADGYRRSQVSGQRLADSGVALLNRVRKGRDSLPEPAAVDDGPRRVVLTGHAVAQLLEPALVAWGAPYTASPLGARSGEQIVDAALNLSCDVGHRALRGRPFDDEGVATRPVELIRGGVARSLVHDRDSAADARVEPTGHSVRVGGVTLVRPRYPVLTLDGDGAPDLASLLADVSDGVLITHFDRVQLDDLASLTLSGRTSAGCFTIDHGDLVGTLQPAPFQVALLDLLNAIEGAGTPRRNSDMVTPALIFGAFPFGEP